MTDPEVPTGSAPGADWFQWVADNSGLVFFVLRARPDIGFEFVNGGMRTQLVGSRPDSSPAAAAALLEHVHPDSAGALEQMLHLEPGTSTSVELRWRHVSGAPVFSRGWVHSRRRPDGSVVVEGAMQDVTELHRVESELRNSERRHRLLAENAWDVIWTMGLDGSITYVSPAVQRVRGISPAEAMGQSLDQIHPPESAASVGAYFERLFAAIAAGDEPPEFRGEHEYYRSDGSIMTGELQVIPHVAADGTVVEILGVTRDISERKRHEAELTEQAVTDPVTGLWNRRHTAQLLSSTLAGAHRSGSPLTLLMLDIDHFKAINDSHGHPTGDRILAEVARRLRDRVRETDVVGRWGGEEFVVMLRSCALAEGAATAETLRRAVAEVPFDTGVTATVSIGVAEICRDEDLSTWLERADDALYRAKRAGRNTVFS